MSAVLAGHGEGAAGHRMFRRLAPGWPAAAGIIMMALSVAEGAADLSRPGPAGAPTEVKLAILIIDIDDISGAEQNFTANVYTEAVWHDPRLAHDGAGGISIFMT